MHRIAAAAAALAFSATAYAGTVQSGGDPAAATGTASAPLSNGPVFAPAFGTGPDGVQPFTPAGSALGNPSDIDKNGLSRPTLQLLLVNPPPAEDSE